MTVAPQWPHAVDRDGDLVARFGTRFVERHARLGGPLNYGRR